MSRAIRVPLVLPLSAFVLSAGLVTTAPSGGTTTTFLGSGDCVSGPGTATATGFSISFTGDVCYDYTGGFGVNPNGNWDISLIGDNSDGTIITIDLGGLYSSVIGFMNYAPGSRTAPIIAVLAADGTTVLESYDLSVFAPISTLGWQIRAPTAALNARRPISGTSGSAGRTVSCTTSLLLARRFLNRRPGCWRCPLCWPSRCCGVSATCSREREFPAGLASARADRAHNR